MKYFGCFHLIKFQHFICIALVNRVNIFNLIRTTVSSGGRMNSIIWIVNNSLL